MLRTLTLGGWLERVYLSERLDISAGSATQLRVAVRLFDRWLGHPSKFQDLTKPNVLGWMRWLSQGRAPATVNSKRQAILALWNAAAEQGLCPPPGRVVKVREPDRIPVAWTIEEIERVFAAIDRLVGEWDGVPVSVCWRLGVLMLWDTGVRLDAMMSARVASVDLARGVWRVAAEHIKGRRGDREFSLHPQTVAAIAASLPSSRALLFPFPSRRRQVWPHLKRILRSAGLPDDRTRMFHCFRRSAESYAASQRGIEWAAAAIGHGVEVARRSYVSPLICRPPALIDGLPRPRLGQSF